MLLLFYVQYHATAFQLDKQIGLVSLFIAKGFMGVFLAPFSFSPIFRVCEMRYYKQYYVLTCPRGRVCWIGMIFRELKRSRSVGSLFQQKSRQQMCSEGKSSCSTWEDGGINRLQLAVIGNPNNQTVVGNSEEPPRGSLIKVLLVCLVVLGHIQLCSGFTHGSVLKNMGTICNA